MTSNIAPVSLFVYNRPDHTERTLSALKNNLLADQTTLIVFCDGAKSNSDEASVKKVRNIVSNIRGFKDLQIVHQKSNQGLASSIISGVSQIMDNYGHGIVVEDDLVTSPHFLSFMNNGLTRFRDEERVISIHGYVYPVEKTLPETFFLRGADCWGWATWKRGWDLFEQDSNSLIQKIEAKNLKYAFNLNNNFDYMKLLQNQADGKSSSWAIRWHASAFLQNKLTLYPGKSFVENIGVDGSGTHCGQVTNYTPQFLASELPDLNSIQVAESEEAKKIISKHLRKDQGTFINSIKAQIKRLIR